MEEIQRKLSILIFVSIYANALRDPAGPWKCGAWKAVIDQVRGLRTAFGPAQLNIASS